MLKNVLSKYHSSFPINPVIFSPRLFTQSCYLDQKHNVKKKIIKFKKHHKPKPRKSPEVETPRSELTEKFRAYIENLILATHEELASVKEKEKLLAASLPEDILELRGLAITNLKLDPRYQCGAETSKQEFSVRLVRADSSKSMPSGGWRPGMLVTVALIDDDQVSDDDDDDNDDDDGYDDESGTYTLQLFRIC